MNEPQPKANMIESCAAYKVGEQTFPTLKEAQLVALLRLVSEGVSTDTERATVECLVSKKDEVLAILMMSEPTPKARKPRSDQGKPHRKKADLKPTGRKYASVDALMKGEGVPQEVQDKVKTTDPEPASCGVKIEASEKYAGT